MPKTDWCKLEQRPEAIHVIVIHSNLFHVRITWTFRELCVVETTIFWLQISFIGQIYLAVQIIPSFKKLDSWNGRVVLILLMSCLLSHFQKSIFPFQISILDPAHALQVISVRRQLLERFTVLSHIVQLLI